jgi:hypothetical protein
MLAKVKRYYYPDGAARRLGSPIPAGAEITVVRSLPKRRAVVEHEGRRYMTSSLCCRNRRSEVVDNCL